MKDYPPLITYHQATAFSGQRIKHIQKYLTPENTNQIDQSLGNFIPGPLYGVLASSLRRFQRIQNWAPKTLLGRGRRYRSSQPGFGCKWLPMEQRILFKILSIIYKCLFSEVQQYLQDLITVKQFARSTRQASNGIMLTVPKTKCKTFVDRSFSVSRPMLWNSLSFTIRSAKTLTIFQRQLKQHLFEKTFVNFM